MLEYLLIKTLFNTGSYSIITGLIIYLSALFFFFCLSIFAMIRLLDIYYWERQFRRIFLAQEQIFRELLPIIDLGKLTKSVIADLGTPLTSLWIILDAFRLTDINQDEEKMERFIQWANDIFFDIRKLISLGRLQVCQDEYKKLFDLRHDILDIFRLIQRRVSKEHIQVKLISEREFRTYAFRDHLMRVITMLIINAMEALIESAEQPKILSVSLIRHPYYLEILINNNYGVIEKKMWPYLFRPNIMSKKKEAGLGMGLYFANAIMEKFYRTKITLKSSKKIGTTLRLKIRNEFLMAEPKTKEPKTYLLPLRF